MEAPPSPLSSRPEESWAFGPPKAMKNGSCSATTVAWKRRPPLCHLDRRSHGPKAHPRPTKTGPVQQLLLLEAPPSPLSSRPEKSWAKGPPKADENGSCSATTVAGSAALPFVISTGEVMGQRPTQGDEKRILFSYYCCWKRRPPLCHLDRRSHGPKAHPR